MRLAIRLGMMVAVAGIAGSACATKGFVRESVGEVNQKVETLSQSLEQTQEQTRENTARIKQVESKGA